MARRTVWEDEDGIDGPWNKAMAILPEVVNSGPEVKAMGVLTRSGAMDPRRVPDGTKAQIKAYAIHRVLPGDFLAAILKNDSRTALCHADDENAHAIMAIWTFIRDTVPAEAWGSAFIVKAWLNRQSVEDLECRNPCEHCEANEEET